MNEKLLVIMSLVLGLILNTLTELGDLAKSFDELHNLSECKETNSNIKLPFCTKNGHDLHTCFIFWNLFIPRCPSSEWPKLINHGPHLQTNNLRTINCGSLILTSYLFYDYVFYISLLYFGLL